MSDPKRLSRESPDEFERALLRAAQRDGASARTKQQILASLSAGLAASLVGEGAAAGLASKSSAWLVATKWALVIGIGAGAIGVAVEFARPTQHAEPATQIPAPPRVAVAVPSAPPQVPSPSPSAPLAPVARRSPPSAVSLRPAASTLSDEVRAIDRARQLAESDDPEQALSAIDAYEKKYGTQKSLGPEARVVRIEALAKAGKHTEARSLAAEFLSKYPTSPYASRVKKVMTSMAKE